MSKEKKRNELGKLLACLLVSRKEACTIKDLERDYFNNEGRSIPYREFGCISSIEFLRTISDHVIIDNSNGVYLVYPVVSDKIKHVNDLVSRQKNAKKSTPVHIRPNRPSKYFPAVRAPKPFIPNNLQKEVAQILTSNASGVDKHYITQYLQQSQAFPGIVDFSNIDEYLKSVPHIAIVNGNMVYPSRSLITLIQSGQRNLRLFNCIDQTTSGVRDSPPRGKKNSNCQMSNWFPGGLDEGEAIYGDEHLASENNLPVFKKNELWEGNYNSVNVSPATATEQSAFHEEAGQVMEQHSKPQYHRATRLDYEDLGGETSYESECTFTSDEDKAMNIISPRIMLRLQQLIKKHPEGIWCADLPQTYLEEYKVGLDYAELGFSSVGQLASKLQNIFTCHRWDDFGDFILYDANSPLPQPPNKLKSHSRTIVWENELDDDEVDPFPMALPLYTSQRLIPDDVLSLRESVGQERIPILRNDERCLEVLVSEVFTPSFFYIHLLKKRITFCQLMDNINEFYQQQGDNYTIPLVVLEKGLNCVCIFQDKWHRAIIKTVKPDGDVMLCFYDFGTVRSYPSENIRFLHKKYSNLPAQAIPCGLFNIKPINSQLWSKGVSSDFWLKIEEVPLIAIVAKVDVENNSMLVSLVDTQGDDDLHINDWMVQQGYAEFGGMVRIRPPNFVLRHAIACAIFNKRMRTAQLLEKLKANTQAAAATVIRSDSESDSSKVKLESAIYVKSLIAKHSKYKKNRNSITNGLFHNISENKDTDCKGDTTSVHAESCVSTNVPVLETVNTSEGIIPKNVEIGIVEERNNANGLAYATSAARRSRAPHDSAVHETSVTVQKCVEHADNDRLPFSGTFRSFFGGHGYMQPIDWSKLRSTVQLDKESMKPKRRLELQTVAASPIFNLSEETKTEPIAELHEVTFQTVEKKMMKQILIAKECFLNAVASNKDHCCSVYSEKLWWWPKGNIQDKVGMMTPLLRMRRKNARHRNAKLMKMSASPKIRRMIRRKNSFSNCNHTIPRARSDSKLDFIMQLKKTVKPQPVKILIPSKSNIPVSIQQSDMFNEQSSISKDDDSKSALSLRNSKPSQLLTSENMKNCTTPNASSNRRFATILHYMNRKKQNSSSISADSVSTNSSHLALDAETIKIPGTIPQSLNRSDTSSILGGICKSEKGVDLFCRSTLNCVSVADNSSNPSQCQISLDINNSVNNINEKRSNCLLSTNLMAVGETGKLSKLEIDTINPDLNTSSQLDCPTTSMKYNQISSPNIMNAESTATTISIYNTNYDKTTVQTAEFSSNILDSASTEKNIKKLGDQCKNTDLLSNNEECITFAAEKGVVPMPKEKYSDSISELDSDDLSHSYDSFSEGDMPNIVIHRPNVDLITSIKSRTLTNDEILHIPHESIFSDTNDDRKELMTSDLDHLPDHIEQITSHVVSNQLKVIAPVFNDLDTVSDDGDWDVIGGWKDFMKDKADYMSSIVKKLEINAQMTESAKIADVTDSQRLD